MWAVTKQQRDLLTRWFDGELKDEQEAKEVEALIESDEHARLWISVLKELRFATRGAFREAREGADLPSGAELAERAADVPPVSQLPLERLAPLLEAYHDDAVTEPERRVVDRLCEEREDVRTFVGGLERLGESVRLATSTGTSASGSVDLWADIASEVDGIDREKLLMRYVDGELDGADLERAESLLADDGPEGDEARSLVDHLGELGDAVRAADREIVDTDLGEIWAGVDEALAGEWAADEADVIDLSSEASSGGARSDSGESEHDAPKPGTQSRPEHAGGVVPLFSEYGQAIAGAAAAVVFMVAGGLLYQNFMVGDAGPQKQVVIVDSYEEKSSSVQVRSVKPTGTQDDSGESKVIWLSDQDGNQNDSKGSNGSAPSGEAPGEAAGGSSPAVGGADVGVERGHNGTDSERSNRDFPDGGTPIENESRGAPADNSPSQVDKPGDGPI